MAPATYYENDAIWDMIHDTTGQPHADKTLRTSLQPNQYVTDEAGTVIKNKYNSAR
jgi:hypothetical protein